MMLWLFAWLFACQTPPSAETVSATTRGIELHDLNGVAPIEIRGGAGQLIATHDNQDNLSHIWMPVDWTEHESVLVTAPKGHQRTDKTLDRPATEDTVRVSVPMGQDHQPIAADGSISFGVVEESTTQAAVSLVAMDARPISVELGTQQTDIPQPYPGQRINIVGEVHQNSTVTISIGDTTFTGRFEPEEISVEQAKANIQIQSIQFPVDARGRRDVARPPGRISLPALWWSRTMERLGLGVRAQDRTVPWGYVAVAVENQGPTPMNIVARMRISEGGKPDPIFRPTMRDVDDGTGWVSVSARVQAGGVSTLTIPVYMDERRLSEQNRNRSGRQLEVAVSATGSSATIAQQTVPLYIHRGSTPAAVGFALGVAASFGGLVLIVARMRRWLALDTPTLVTIALFSTMSFVVNAAAQIVGIGVSTILGPFAFLVTGLIDDTIRACLLATLLRLRPYPGVCALSVMVGWLLRSVVLGSATPTDLLYLTGHVFFLEASMWIFGLTRGKALSFLRMGFSFVTTFSATMLTALAFNVVMYRLFYADWYVALSVLTSGILYPLLACAIAVPFANTLKRVED